MTENIDSDIFSEREKPNVNPNDLFRKALFVRKVDDDIKKKMAEDAAKFLSFKSREASILDANANNIKAPNLNLIPKVDVGDYTDNRYQYLHAQRNPHFGAGMAMVEAVSNPFKQAIMSSKERNNNLIDIMNDIARYKAKVNLRNQEWSREDKVRERNRMSTIDEPFDTSLITKFGTAEQGAKAIELAKEWAKLASTKVDPSELSIMEYNKNIIKNQLSELMNDVQSARGTVDVSGLDPIRLERGTGLGGLRRNVEDSLDRVVGKVGDIFGSERITSESSRRLANSANNAWANRLAEAMTDAGISNPTIYKVKPTQEMIDAAKLIDRNAGGEFIAVPNFAGRKGNVLVYLSAGTPYVINTDDIAGTSFVRAK